MFFLVSRFKENVDGNMVRRVRGELQEYPFNSNGFHVVDVPDNISIDETNTSTSGVPTFTYQDLLSEKYTGFNDLDNHYDYVKYFDLVSGEMDLNASGTRGGGNSLTTFLAKNDSTAGKGLLRTDTIDISNDTPGSFTDFAAHWTVYSLSKSESNNRTTKTYQKEAVDSIDAFISNDGGSSFQQVQHLDNTVLGSSGNQVVMKFENTDSSKRYYLGDFGFLY